MLVNPLLLAIIVCAVGFKLLGAIIVERLLKVSRIHYGNTRKAQTLREAGFAVTHGLASLGQAEPLHRHPRTDGPHCRRASRCQKYPVNLAPLWSLHTHAIDLWLGLVKGTRTEVVAAGEVRN